MLAAMRALEQAAAAFAANKQQYGPYLIRLIEIETALRENFHA
ncbi:hypothetical protein LJR084_006859 [Variovorax sp. LjRoot84]